MLIKNVRLSYPSLFRPTSFDGKQEPKYQAHFIFEKGSETHKAVKAAIAKTIEDKWGDRPGDLTAEKICLKDGKTKVNKEGDYLDGYGPDVVFITTSSRKRPGVFNVDRSPLTEEDGIPYAGCYVNAQIEFWAQDNKFGKRINCELRGVQFVRDGDAFGGGGRPATADDFPELEPSDDGVQGQANDVPWDDDEDDDPLA